MARLQDYIGTYHGVTQYVADRAKRYETEVEITNDSVTIRTAMTGGAKTEIIPLQTFSEMEDDLVQDDLASDAETEVGFSSDEKRTRLFFQDTALLGADMFGLIVGSGDEKLTMLFTPVQIAGGDLEKFLAEITKEDPDSLVRLPSK